MTSSDALLFLAKGDRSRIESRVIHQLMNGILEVDKNRNVEVIQQSSTVRIWKSITQIFNTEIIIVHSSLIKSGLEIVLAFFLRKKIVAFIWDVYPVIIKGERYNPKILRRIADFFEACLLKMCRLIIVPSEDFLSIDYLNNAQILNFWPSFSLIDVSPIDTKKINADKIRIIFSGQINPTRDLESAINHINKITNGNFEFTVASGDPLPDDLSKHDSIKYVGYLNETDLKFELLNNDFGLICLSKNLDTPGFPSKIFDYLKTGLPCFYYGPLLKSYISTIESTGVGINISNRENLDRKSLNKMIANMPENSIQFKRLTCLDNKAVLKFLSLLNRL